MRRVIAVAMVVVVAACSAAAPSVPEPSATRGLSPSPTAASSAVPSPTATPEPTPADLSERPLVWFAPLPPLPTDAGRPYIGSDDFLGLFATGAPWPAAAARVGVFKLYGEWVDVAHPAALKSAVGGIAARGMVVGVEAGPLDPAASCGEGVEGFAGRESGLRLARRVRDAGDVLGVIALDEPWYFAHVYDGPNACKWPVDQVAEGVAAFIDAVRTEFPAVVVGDIEPTPIPVDAAGLGEWIDAYTKAVGEPPAFLHIDADWSRADWPARTLAIEAEARGRGVPFGLIYNGGSATSDGAWIHRSGTRILEYEDGAGGRPDHVIFQSWMDKPDAVLPESSPTAFTGLINRYFDDRAALDDPPPGTEVNLALGKAVSASSALGDGPASNAVDGDADTSWNSGAEPPGWIEVDLGSAVEIGEVRLVVGQFPGGPTEHRITGRASPSGPVVKIATLKGATADNNVLTAAVDSETPALRYLRVETTASPSWVAWREIEVLTRVP
jgi:hypothetical protein